MFKNIDQSMNLNFVIIVKPKIDPTIVYLYQSMD